MTRTHFKAIASIVDECSLVNDGYVVKGALVNALCDYFECINDRFDRDKFKSACNKESITDMIHNLQSQLISKDIR